MQAVATDTGAGTGAVTREERVAARDRIFQDAGSRLTFGPVQALASGCASVFGLSCLEGSIYLRSSALYTFEGMKFICRYGLANMIPSLIWGRVEAETIVLALKLSSHILHERLPPQSLWHQTRIQSLRGAIAGSLVISQVFSLAQVFSSAQDSYKQRICDGREPPLHDKRQNEVIVRLSGQTSDVTALGIERDGRRKYFPVFEQSQHPQTQQMVRKYGLGLGKYAVPVYWQVDDGQYGHLDSWQGMSIPPEWLFTKKNRGASSWQASKVLILEADATNGNSMSLWGLREPKETGELDLDLYEAAQGFSRLRSLVGGEPSNFDVLRVLLVDADAVFKSGGGRVQSVRDYVTGLGLADVIIDARAPLLHSLDKWLRQRKRKDCHKPGWGLSPSVWTADNLNPVVLETPCSKSFASIKSALGELGYTVLDISRALKDYGSLQDIPVLVYEKNTQGTIHTIKYMLERNVVQPANVCALCPTHHGLVELANEQASEIEIICGSDIYDNLLLLVRNLAIEGCSPEEIQKQLDVGYLPRANAKSFMKRRLGFPTSPP